MQNMWTSVYSLSWPEVADETCWRYSSSGTGEGVVVDGCGRIVEAECSGAAFNFDLALLGLGIRLAQDVEAREAIGLARH
jgi:hypothetical protein